MAFQREPILWTSDTSGDFNRPDRELVLTDRKGKRVVERVPQQAHDGAGGYENPVRLRNMRSMLVVRHDGNVVDLNLTNAAAHVDLNTTYAAFQISKARHYGWFRAGSCPVSLVAAGELDPERDVPIIGYGSVIADKSSIEGDPCQPGTYSDRYNGVATKQPDGSFVQPMPGPCKHALAEIAARQKRHTAIEEARRTAHKSDTDKLIEAQKDIQGESTAALVELAKALAANQLAEKNKK